MIDDSLISFPPAYDRVPKPTRPIIILSSISYSADPSWGFVVAVPTSTSPHYVTRACVELTRSRDKVNQDCWARTALTQPFAKQDLLAAGSHLTGSIPMDSLNEIQAAYLDMLHLPDFDEHTIVGVGDIIANDISSPIGTLPRIAGATPNVMPKQKP